MNREVAILREVVMKLTPMLAGRGLRVTQQGAGAFVESDKKGVPVRVNIPHIPDNASPDLILAIQGFIDHEVAHIFFTDFKLMSETKRLAPKLGNLLNIVEDTMIERRIAEKFPGATSNLDRLHEFFFEKITLPAVKAAKGDPEREFGALVVPIVRAWSGQKLFDRKLRENGFWEQPIVKRLVDAMPPDVKARIPKLRTTIESLAVAKVIDKILSPPPPPEPEPDDPAAPESEKDKASSKSKTKSEDEDGKGSNPELPEDEDDKGAGGEPSDEESEDAGSDDDSDDGEPAPADEASSEEAPEPEGSDPAEPEDDDDVGEGRSGDDDGDEGAPEEEEESAAGGAAGEAGEEEGDDGSVGGEGEDEDGDDEASGGAKGGEDDSDDAGKSKAPEKMVLEDGPAGIGDFDPADFDGMIEAMITDEASRETRGADYRVFTNDFDQIAPLEISKSYKPEWLETLNDDIGHMVGPMQKEIERMMAARSQVMNVSGYRSGRLHGAALHRLKVNDDRVFRRKHETKALETVVTLLIDNSGSMGGTKQRVAMSAGYALSQTLERVRIPHEVIGFTTLLPTREQRKAISAEEARLGRAFSRYEPLHMPVYKGFEEKLTPETRKRFAQSAMHGDFLRNNVDGECLRIAGKRIAKRPEVRKVILVLSDGQPCCDGNSREVHSDLHKAVAELDRAKIETIGIGIMDAAVSTYYPKHIVLRDLSALPQLVMGELKRILLAA